MTFGPMLKDRLTTTDEETQNAERRMQNGDCGLEFRG